MNTVHLREPRRPLRAGLASLAVATTLGVVITVTTTWTSASDGAVAETPAASTDGILTARVVAVDAASRSAVLDEVEVLDGDAARAAAVAAGELAPGEDLPNDAYLRDADDLTRTLAFDPAAVIEVVDCEDRCHLVGVGLDELLRGGVRPLNGGHAVWTAQVEGGALVRLSEVYLP